MSFGLPETLPFDRVFMSVFDRLVEDSYHTLAQDEPDTYIDFYDNMGSDTPEQDGKDECRTQLRNAISETLMALCVDEPDGDRPDWLRHLHGLCEGRLPNLYEWITEDGDAVEAEDEARSMLAKCMHT